MIPPTRHPQPAHSTSTCTRARVCNLTYAETHVPVVIDGRPGLENVGGEGELENARRFGKGIWGSLQLFLHLVVGWPAYLLFGATGGPKYGTSNHFIPIKPFNTNLWPGKLSRTGSPKCVASLSSPQHCDSLPGNWPLKVWRSDLGVAAMLSGLWLLASKVIPPQQWARRWTKAYG